MIVGGIANTPTLRDHKFLNRIRSIFAPLKIGAFHLYNGGISSLQQRKKKSKSATKNGIGMGA